MRLNLNWTNLPYNRNKLYVQIELIGRCTLYVPVESDEGSALLAVEKDLKNFAKNQAVSLRKKAT